MDFDDLDMPPPPPGPPHGHDFGFHDGEPLIQFDVAQNDHSRPARNQQPKQKGNKNTNLAFGNNQPNGMPGTVLNNSAKTDPSRRPEPVEIQYKGFMLKKAEPYVGEEPSWARVVQNPLPFSNAKLAEQSKKIRYDTKTDAVTAYSTLTREQSGVVERIIAKLQNEERVKNAVWVLDSVWKYKETVRISWTRDERRTSKIQIILKRQDKNALIPGQKSMATKQKVYQSGEVIDLSEPAPKKKIDPFQNQNLNQNQPNIKAAKVKNAQPKQVIQDPFLNFPDDHRPPPQQQWPDPFAFHDEPVMRGGLPDPFAGLGHQEPLPMNGMHDQRGQFPHQHNHPPPPPPHHNMSGPQIPPPAPPPPGAIPIDDFNRNHGPMGNQQPRFDDFSHPPTLRHEFDDNPFRPNDNVYTPGGYDLPPNMQNIPLSRSRPRARSLTQGLQYSSRDPSRDHPREPSYDGRDRDISRRRSEKASRRNSKQLQRKVDNLDDKMEEVILKIDDWRLQSHEDAARDRGRRRLRDHAHQDSTSSDSTSSYFADNNHLWSTGSGASFTPPSTPPLEYSKGSLSRRNTVSGRNRYPSQRRYSDYREGPILIEPVRSSHRRRQSEVLPISSGRHSSRPALHHSSTWQGNDYPNFPVAERPVRVIQHSDEYDRDRGGYADYGGRSKYDGRRGSRRRDSAYGRERDWDDNRGGRVYVDDGRRRSRGYIH